MSAKNAKHCAALAAVLLVLAAAISDAAGVCYLGVFSAREGVEGRYELSTNDLPSGACPGGVLSYGVANAHGNTAAFPNVHQGVLQFRAASTGMTSGWRTTLVDLSVLCNGVTPVCSSAVAYFSVSPAPTTSAEPTPTPTPSPIPTPTPTPAPGITCKSPSPITVGDGEASIISASSLTDSCANPTLSIKSQTAPSGAAASLFATSFSGGSWMVTFNDDGDAAAAGTYTAVITVQCGTASCDATQQVVIGTPAPTATPTASPTPAPTATPAPVPTCPGSYAYTFALNADGTYTAQTVSLTQRATAGGGFCAAGGQITTRVGAARDGVVTSDSSAGTFSYTPHTVAAGDAIDAFDFTLTCSVDGTTCAGTAVISIAAQDSGDVYYARGGAITCRGTCDAAAWRAAPDATTLFETSASGVAVSPRKDGRAADGVDFGFTLDGELLIHAYTTIGNIAARFVTFFPLTAAAAAGYLDASAVQDGSHVSFEPSCLNNQATTGAASSIWTWTSVSSLTGHLNTETNAYKSGDNYYQKFGGNHRQCDVYRSDPCKYAPLMTPTLNDDNNNAENDQTPSVQWKLYVNDCDATWVGKASVESLRALRQPDGSPTFRLEGNGRYLVGTVYTQSVKPASWTTPSAGIVHAERAYEVRLKIHNSIIVDAHALPIASTEVPEALQLSINADVQYSVGKTKETKERLYAYSLLLYPYFTANATAADTTGGKILASSVALINATWTSPSHVECPKCTGTMITCIGTGDGFKTDCGDKALMVFEAIDYDASDFSDWGDAQNSSHVFASTTVGTQNAIRVTFAARAIGNGTADSTDAYPVGSFAIAVKLSNKQVFHVVVNQSDYISELNTRFLDTQMCRPSAYWPVPDPLGTSLPVLPYNVDVLLRGAASTSAGEAEKEEEKEEEYYGAPERLSSVETCAKLPSMSSTHVQVSSMTATITEGTESRKVAMCAVKDERTFGVTDWVMLSLPSIQEELDKVTAENINNIVADSQLANDNAYTVGQLQYLMLTVPAAEVGSSLLATSATGDFLSILLEGDNPPASPRTEESMWMYPNSDSSSAAITEQYLPWEIYASSLSYRRVGLRTSSSSSTSTVSEPFNFAFIPGSLLHSSSSIRVSMTVRAAIKFSTYAHTPANATQASQVVKTAEREESLLYVVSVSRGISSALRVDTDSYHPVVTKSGIGKKSATAILIVLIIGVVCVMAASVYVEITYKRIIHNAKYHPKRPESAVGIRYGRDGKPKENQKTAKEGSRAEVSAAASASKTRAGGKAVGDATDAGVKTKFGTVRGEQVRVRESVDRSGSASSDASPTDRGGNDDYAVENPPVGEEQVRVADDEVAEW